MINNVCLKDIYIERQNLLKRMVLVTNAFSIHTL